MPIGVTTIIHSVLFVLVVIELGLTGYVVNVTSNNFFGLSSPASFSFMLFNSIWSLLVLLYLAITPLFFARAYHGLVAFGLLAVTTIFWFAGSIAMAVDIGVPVCHGNNFCQSAQAAVAFGFFIWAIFTALATLEGLATLGGRARADKVSQPAV